MSDFLKIDIDKFVENLDAVAKDDLYRKLWFEYIESDVSSRLNDRKSEILQSHPDETCYSNKARFVRIAKTVAYRYAYNCEYDCNESYWDNIDGLIDSELQRRSRGDKNEV